MVIDFSSIVFVYYYGGTKSIHNTLWYNAGLPGYNIVYYIKYTFRVKHLWYNIGVLYKV